MTSRARFYRPSPNNSAFTDLLFNALLGFAFMFFIAFILMAKPEESGKVDNKAEYLITISWPNNHPDDIDVLVEDPRGEVLWYSNKDTGIMHLDRDDRGSLQDHLIIDGKKVINPINQETVTLRSWIPGEYVVNVLHYQANSQQPVPVYVKVEKLNPEVKMLYYGIEQVNGIGTERTVVRFVLDGQGDVSDVSQLQKSLVDRIGKKAEG